MMMGTKFDIEKFDRKNDFALWQVRMKALLEQQGLAATLEELQAATIMAYVNDLANIDTAILDEDEALLLFTYLPSSYQNFMETLLYGRDTLKLEDVLATLNSRELQKMTEAKGDGGEGLYVRGRSGQRDMEQGRDSMWPKSQGESIKLRCYICQSEEHLKRDCDKIIWMAFGGKTRDLGSNEEETDKTTTLHQSLLKNSVQCLETASRFIQATASRFPRWCSRLKRNPRRFG
ncbi:retrovirus-related pol polyprotein from transposon TNT 1-94 [Tanacetum coccineum]